MTSNYFIIFFNSTKNWDFSIWNATKLFNWHHQVEYFFETFHIWTWMHWRLSISETSGRNWCTEKVQFLRLCFLTDKSKGTFPFCSLFMFLFKLLLRRASPRCHHTVYNQKLCFSKGSIWQARVSLFSMVSFFAWASSNRWELGAIDNHD